MIRASALGLVCSAALASSDTIVPTAENRGPNTIAISGFKFSPSEIVVNAGDTIVWHNRDSFVHTTASDSGGWNSGELQRDHRFQFVPGRAGRFPYHCAAHPVMRGVLIVRQ
jgi:plastocyanin